MQCTQHDHVNDHDNENERKIKFPMPSMVLSFTYVPSFKQIKNIQYKARIFTFAMDRMKN